MTGFDIKDELGNIGGDIVRSGVSRVINIVINRIANYFRNRSMQKKTRTPNPALQTPPTPPVPPIPDSNNQEAQNS